MEVGARVLETFGFALGITDDGEGPAADFGDKDLWAFGGFIEVLGAGLDNAEFVSGAFAGCICCLFVPGGFTVLEGAGGNVYCVVQRLARLELMDRTLLDWVLNCIKALFTCRLRRLKKRNLISTHTSTNSSEHSIAISPGSIAFFRCSQHSHSPVSVQSTTKIFRFP